MRPRSPQRHEHGVSNPEVNQANWPGLKSDRLLGNRGQPSRSIPWPAVVEAQPDVLTVAVCGFGIGRTMEDMRILESWSGWADLPAVRRGRVYVIDGHHYFNRPGPRLVDSLEILAHALHPDIHPPAPTAMPALNYVQARTDGPHPG